MIRKCFVAKRQRASLAMALFVVALALGGCQGTRMQTEHAPDGAVGDASTDSGLQVTCEAIAKTGECYAHTVTPAKKALIDLYIRECTEDGGHMIPSGACPTDGKLGTCTNVPDSNGTVSFEIYYAFEGRTTSDDWQTVCWNGGGSFSK
jgi:hypothetical protein